MSTEKLVRLSKLMSERNICSRREADVLIAQGLVLVNEQPITQLGSKVAPDVSIELKEAALVAQSRKLTILLNKPIGYVSCQPEKGYPPASDLLTADRCYGWYRPFPHHKLAVSGRLDIESQGLLIFTQDGRLAKRLIGESGTIEKEYLVRVVGHLRNHQLELLRHGIILDGRPLKPAKVEWVKNGQLRFVLCEGRKRQIRRMCSAVGLKVIGLKRVRVGQLCLGGLKQGHWRFLRPHESI